MNDQKETENEKKELFKISLGEIYEPNKSRVNSTILDLVKSKKYSCI